MELPDIKEFNKIGYSIAVVVHAAYGRIGLEKEKRRNMALFIELLLMGVGLAMDAFAVSVCKGLGMKKLNKKQALSLIHI